MSGDIRGPHINHPIVIVKNTATAAFFMLIMLVSFINQEEASKLFMGAAAILAVLIVFIVVSWKRTSIEFGDQEITVRHNFLYRKTHVIPYPRIASVNVTRNIFDRIVGTETLKFNVNSSVNATAPEASFTFRRELAEEIRDLIYSLTFETESKEDRDEEHESVVSFSPAQVIMHSMLSQPTWQVLLAGLFLLIAVVSLFTESSSGLLLGVTLFAVQEVLPFVSVLLRYFGFRMYRDGEAICLQYGAIQNYRTEFDVGRINAIRLRRPFLARLFHRSCLEAEVVGIDATSTATPLLCLLMPDAEAEALIGRILPEFDCEIEETSPPREAWKTMACQALVFDAVLIAVMAWPCWWAFHEMDTAGFAEGVLTDAVRLSPAILTVLVALYAFWRGWRSFLLRSIGFGEDKLVMRNGLLDREWVMIQYDRIQITEVSGDMISRHFGVSHCTVYLLSTTGSKNVTSGYFRTEMLEMLPSLIQERIREGHYGPDRDLGTTGARRSL